MKLIRAYVLWFGEVSSHLWTYKHKSAENNLIDAYKKSIIVAYEEVVTKANLYLCFKAGQNKKLSDLLKGFSELNKPAVVMFRGARKSLNVSQSRRQLAQSVADAIEYGAKIFKKPGETILFEYRGRGWNNKAGNGILSFFDWPPSSDSMMFLSLQYVLGWSITAERDDMRRDHFHIVIDTSQGPSAEPSSDSDDNRK